MPAVIPLGVTAYLYTALSRLCTILRPPRDSHLTTGGTSNVTQPLLHPFLLSKATLGIALFCLVTGQMPWRTVSDIWEHLLSSPPSKGQMGAQGGLLCPTWLGLAPEPAFWTTVLGPQWTGWCPHGCSSVERDLCDTKSQQQQPQSHSLYITQWQVLVLCVCDPWVRKIPWRRKWQPTPVSLPEKAHGQRSLAGYSPRGCKVGHDWATNTHTDVHTHPEVLSSHTNPTKYYFLCCGSKKPDPKPWG